MNLGAMRTMVRDILGEDSAAYWSDALLNRFINRAAKEIYARLLQMHEDYFVTSAYITYVAGTELYNLPASGDVVKVTLVERIDGTYKINLLPIPLVRKNDFQAVGIVFPTGNERFFLVGNQIGFAPIPNQSISNAVRVWYIPSLADLGSDSANFPTEWSDLHHEVVVWGAIMRALARDKQMMEIHKPTFDRLYGMMVDDMASRQDEEPKRIIPTDDAVY